ncbi:MAG: gluconolaconase [Jatrophihabitans sp.]
MRRLGRALPAAALIALAGCGAQTKNNDPAPLPASAGAALYSARVQVPSGMGGAPFDRTRSLQIPRGWTVSVWARISGARLMVQTPDARLLVSRPSSGDIQVLTPRSGRATPSKRTLVSGLRLPHGMAFRGSTLYVAESNRIDTFQYSDGKVSTRRTIISGLPDSKSPELGGAYAHALKSVVVAKDGTVYVSVGSTGNISANDRTASPQRATILRWSPTTRKVSVFARGVRNGTGLALDPGGALWTAVNNRDQMPYPYHRDYGGDGRSDYGKVMQSYVNDHPMELLAKLTAGRDLGWPYCDPEPDTKPGVKGSPLAYTDRPYVRDVDTNPTGAKLNCATLPRLENGFPAHSAPLGMTFATLPGTGGTGAIVATHGSWNRTPPRAPSVSFFPWSNGRLGANKLLVSGFQLADGSRWGRPVAAVTGTKALYVSDDLAGAIYKLTPG